MVRVVGTPSLPPPSVVTMSLESVLVCGPESVSYERSRRMRHANRREISARVFFVKIPQSQNSMIYNIKVIRLACVPVFPGSLVIRMACVPIFPGSLLVRMACVPVFPGYLVAFSRFFFCCFSFYKLNCVPVFPGSKLNQSDWFSSISRIPSY